ncbi:TIGR04283 family arsenosugar biosynthesis glycosyltransferase [Microbaculum marinum]|uniref:TIGR04283 family arsenosugar biosynthesis glycosyltransferase n=1 Tax=Microbaculum marinum TaxID=1764581 RepID=A0AAW9RQR5_9HYPH
MLTVVIPTLDSERPLVATLAALIPAAAAGVVSQVVICDGGSGDDTLAIADELGCDIVSAPRGRGPQLAAGARAARHPWILFLHSDTVLDEGWHREVAHFIERTGESDDRDRRAAVFRFALDDYGIGARFLETIVQLRCLLFALPYGDQGLLISRRHYESLGGFRPIPLMEDIDLVRRIGRRGLVYLRARAVTSAARYRHEGYVRRMARNAGCLTLFFLRVPPRLITRIYG